MSLSPDRKAIAERAIQKTFEQVSVAWKAIPHWDTHDPGQTLVRNDVVFSFGQGNPFKSRPDPFDVAALELEHHMTPFRLTLAQATAPTPDALLAAVIRRTVTLAREFDDAVLAQLIEPFEGGTATLAKSPASDWLITWDVVAAEARAEAAKDQAAPKKAPGKDAAAETATGAAAAPEQAADTNPTPQNILPQLLRARARLEDSGYRAPCGLITSTNHYNDLNRWVDGDVAFPKLLAGANVDSVHRTSRLNKAINGADATLMLGRMQQFPHGDASGVSPGEEPVDLAISVPPSLEVIGERSDGTIELAIRIRFATRVKDRRGVVVFYT